MTAGDITAVVDEVLAHPYSNPRPVTRHALESIVRAAWGGEGR